MLLCAVCPDCVAEDIEGCELRLGARWIDADEGTDVKVVVVEGPGGLLKLTEAEDGMEARLGALEKASDGGAVVGRVALGVMSEMPGSVPRLDPPAMSCGA